MDDKPTPVPHDWQPIGESSNWEHVLQWKCTRCERVAKDSESVSLECYGKAGQLALDVERQQAHIAHHEASIKRSQMAIYRLKAGKL